MYYTFRYYFQIAIYHIGNVFRHRNLYKTEMPDSQEIKIVNIEQFIKVEVDENVAFDLTNKGQEIEKKYVNQ